MNFSVQLQSRSYSHCRSQCVPILGCALSSHDVVQYGGTSQRLATVIERCSLLQSLSINVWRVSYPNAHSFALLSLRREFLQLGFQAKRCTTLEFLELQEAFSACRFENFQIQVEEMLEENVRRYITRGKLANTSGRENAMKCVLRPFVKGCSTT